MECKAEGPVYCVMHVKEPSALIAKRRGFAQVFLAVAAAECTTAPCKPKKVLHKWVSLFKNIALLILLKNKLWGR